MERKATEVSIFGHKFTLSGTSDPEEMRALASKLDERMKDLAKPKPGEPIHRVAIYAALVLLDELGRAQRALDDERRRFEAASRSAAQLDLKLHSLLNEAVRIEHPAGLDMEEHSELLELDGMDGSGGEESR